MTNYNTIYQVSTLPLYDRYRTEPEIIEPERIVAAYDWGDFFASRELAMKEQYKKATDKAKETALKNRGRIKTRKEEVFELYNQGLTKNEIAIKLGVTLNCVRSCYCNLGLSCGKMGRPPKHKPPMQTYQEE